MVKSIAGRVAFIALLRVIGALAALGATIVGVAPSPEFYAARAAAPSPRRGGSGRQPGSPADARTLVRTQVTAADPATGRVDLAAEGLTLTATFPASVVAELRPGHIVYVTVDVIDTRLGTVAGSIKAVDQARGTVAVETAGGVLALAPSSTALSGMKEGDGVLLKLNLVDIGPAP